VSAPANAVLFGAGADIGCNLLGHNEPDRDGFAITDVVTHYIDADRTLGELGPMQQLRARILLADPTLLGLVDVDEDERTLLVRGRTVRVHFLDLTDPAVLRLGPFRLAIVATHRDHIRSMVTMRRLREIAEYVLGVAENTALPGLYTPLFGADLSVLDLLAQPAGTAGGVFALGSCQCVGWTAQLRGLVEAAGVAGLGSLGLVRAEVEIVHPDTASSRFGTHGIGARREDARDNLRPGFSQLAGSMSRLVGVSTLNTVSLRVLTQPPGYQVSRFFVRAPLDAAEVREGFRQAAAALPSVIQTTDIPIGSRAFSACGAAATVLTAPTHLSVTADVLPGSGVTEVITQTYVHNTIGYCTSVLCAGRYLLTGDAVVLPPVRAAVTA
jgi:hypothetical protein